MGEWTTVDLRKMAGALPFADMDRGIPETSNALRWAADRIDYLEGFIEATGRAAAQARSSRSRQTLSDNTKMENQ